MFFAAKKIDSRQRHQKSLPTVFGAVCSSISVYPLVDEADEQRHAGSALPAHSAGPGLRHAVTRITAGTFCRDKDALAILLYVPLDLEQQKYIFLVLQVQVFKTKYATYI